MSPADRLDGSLQEACATCTHLSFPMSECLSVPSPSQWSDIGSLFPWLETMPVLAFLEHGSELVAANQLARDAIGRDSVMTDVTLLGAYPKASHAGRQRFECLLSLPNGKVSMVPGVVQSLNAADSNTRLVLLMEPLPDDADRLGGDCIQQKCNFLQEVFDSASQAMVIVQEDRVLRANREFSRIFAYPIEACLGKELCNLIVPDGRLHETEMLNHTVEQDDRASMETVRHTSMGELLDVLVSVTRVRLGAGRLGQLVTYRDIRQEKRLQARLQHASLHDPVTGLANRVLFLDRLSLTMARLRRRPNRSFAVVFLDLDHFKRVNDTWGHAAGDMLLLSVAARLRSCLRPQDTVARFGGDEFALLLDDTDSLEAIDNLAQRIQHELQRPVDLDGPNVCITASMGIVLGSTEYSDIEVILCDADAAMYHAKELGRARHEFFTSCTCAIPDRGRLSARTDPRKAI